MQVEISKTENYYQIRIPIPECYSNLYFRRFIDYMQIRKVAEKSTATDDDINKLSEEIIEKWWDRKGHNLVRE